MVIARHLANWGRIRRQSKEMTSLILQRSLAIAFNKGSAIN